MMLISVIIPALNEAGRLPPLIDALRAEPVECEIIVVDGHSDDDTKGVAKATGARVLEAPRGRGQQISAGCAEARGDVLLHLHADTVFPAGGLVAIARVLEADDQIVGGNFSIIFDGDTEFARWLTDFYAWFRGHGLYYGDSGIFVRRSVYEQLGGIRPIAVMEDFDFSQRLERAGNTTCIKEPPIVSSSRRFAGRKRWRIVTGWIVMHVLYYLGAPPDRLAALYNSARR
jgi:rSAM/selenodomain-associated transferase 2